MFEFKSIFALLHLIVYVYIPTIHFANAAYISYAFGEWHFCFVNDLGNLKCWGLNDNGQLGLGDTNNRGDQLNEMDYHLPNVNVGEEVTVQKVGCGGFHTCIILNNNAVKCFGMNGAGQLGQGDTNNRGSASNQMGNNLPNILLSAVGNPTDLALGSMFTCVLFDNSQVKCFGWNIFGALGYEDTITRGTLPSQMGNSLPFINFDALVSSVHSSGSALHSCIIAQNQKLKCWGANWAGQLGYSHTNNLGDNASEMGSSLPFIYLGTESRVKQVSVGYQHTCSLTYADELKCWGGNSNGQLGIGSTTSPIINFGTLATTIVDSTGKKAKQITSLGSHLCVLLDDNRSVKCVGLNDSGQLGLGDTTNRGTSPSNTLNNIPLVIPVATTGFNAIYVVATQHNTCIMYDINNLVRCFGDGQYGQIGHGSTSDRGDQPNQKYPFVTFFTPTPSPSTPSPFTSG